ncbi:MAG: hypothetical protein FVQ79_03930 [Planctomycetes bacterium]|nr:hypothetical protein [Planctomycetota bacterium]
MLTKVLLLLKVVVFIATIALAILATVYVLDLITAENMKELVMKIMTITGIFTGASLIILFLANTGKDA